MAGYSQTPLAKKLGIRTGSRVVLLGAPEGFSSALEPLPEGASVGSELPGKGDVDVVVWFCRARAELAGELEGVARRLAPAGGLWVAWPKKASGVATDLDFSVVQAAGLDLGLVDNKVCAVDEVFSGLRFVVRKEDRETWAARRRP
jgi:hypothetical protein